MSYELQMKYKKTKTMCHYLFHGGCIEAKLTPFIYCDSFVDPVNISFYDISNEVNEYEGEAHNNKLLFNTYGNS